MTKTVTLPLPRNISDLGDMGYLFGAQMKDSLSIGSDELFSTTNRIIRIAENRIMVFRYADLRALGSRKEIINVPADFAALASYYKPLGIAPDDPKFQEVRRLSRNSFFSADPQKHSILKPVFTRSLATDQMPVFASIAEKVAGSLIERYAGQGEIEFADAFGQGLAFGLWADIFEMSDAEIATLHELNEGMSPIVTPGSITYDRFVRLNEAIPAYIDFMTMILRRARESGRVEFLAQFFRLFSAIKEMPTIAPESNEAVMAISMLDGFDALGGNIASLAYALVKYPDIAEALRNDFSLAPDVVSEALRLFAPVRTIARYAVADVEYDGLLIPEGTVLLMNWGAGSRDPEVYDDPLNMVLGRPNRPPATFGGGRQVCPGQNLVRVMAMSALKALHEANVTLTLTGTPVWWTSAPVPFNAKLTSLPIAIERS